MGHRLLALRLIAFLWSLLIPGVAHADFRQCLRSEVEQLQALEYKKWQWLHSDCEDCQVVFLIQDKKLRHPRFETYVRTLAEEKANLLKLYADTRLTSQEYNLLAHMAIGVLGPESQVWGSSRYIIKEGWLTQHALTRWKVAVELWELVLEAGQFSKDYVGSYVDGRPYEWDDTFYVEPNSRGPTQLKAIPKRIEENYPIDLDSLRNGRNAALATVGHIIEDFYNLKLRLARAKAAKAKGRVPKIDLPEVTPETYIDYLPYYYFGAREVLFRNQAEPWRRPYIRSMKNTMAAVIVFEKNEAANPRTLPYFLLSNGTNHAGSCE